MLSPVYTAKTVLKLLPAVLMSTLPDTGAIQLHQTECPPETPAWSGSSTSAVAKVFQLVMRALVPEIGIRSTKLSLGGGTRFIVNHTGADRVEAPKLSMACAITKCPPAGTLFQIKSK